MRKSAGTESQLPALAAQGFPKSHLETPEKRPVCCPCIQTATASKEYDFVCFSKFHILRKDLSQDMGRNKDMRRMKIYNRPWEVSRRR